MARSAVEGLQVFRQHMQEAEGSYALIGGTACDILLAEAGLSFRATHDFDVVIVADPYDTTDHNQDGYGVYSAERFLYNFTFYNFFDDASGELNDMCFLVATPQ